MNREKEERYMMFFIFIIIIKENLFILKSFF